MHMKGPISLILIALSTTALLVPNVPGKHLYSRKDVFLTGHTPNEIDDLQEQNAGHTPNEIDDLHDQNAQYHSLTNLLDKYILTGSGNVKKEADYLINEIRKKGDYDFLKKVERVCNRAGFPVAAAGDEQERDDDPLPLPTSAPTTIVEREVLLRNGKYLTPEELDIGGMDDVISEVRRRIWVPLAAPLPLLESLGISPPRGLLLHGEPGVGKTLLARRLASVLSPLRPATFVAGPEMMEKFVGESEKNVRAIFDFPPPVHDEYAGVKPEPLHVIIFDEFDAVSRARGGSGETQGDAGVARDSVVNQLLAKMDGLRSDDEGHAVPTLVIALTNKRSLIDPALLRSGRLEVKIEVKPPESVEQRAEIFRIHSKRMSEGGWLRYNSESSQSCDYEALVEEMASQTTNFTGADIAAVCRASAATALERAVTLAEEGDMSVEENCFVDEKDMFAAIEEIRDQK